MKKLIYILNHYSDNDSSHFFHIHKLLEEIANRHNVQIVLIIEKAKDTPEFTNPNIKVITQKENGIKRYFELYKILKTLNKEGYKKTFVRISQNGAIPAILISKKYGGEVYYWQSGTTHQMDTDKSFKHLIKSKIPFEIVKRFTDYFVTGPESMIDYYEHNIGVKKEKLICLYNDIDISRFTLLAPDKKIELKKELNIDPNKKIILFVKRMSKVKGILYYFPYIIEHIQDTIRKYNYQCLLIGDGSEKEKLENRIREKKLNDIMITLGNIPNKEIEKYYQISNLFINATLEEGFPRVLLEAMGSGLPFITTDAGGISDLIGKAEQKFMVNKNDRELFSDALKNFIENEKHVSCILKEENLKQVQKYSTPNVAKMYVETIFKENKNEK